VGGGERVTRGRHPLKGQVSAFWLNTLIITTMLLRWLSVAVADRPADEPKADISGFDSSAYDECVRSGDCEVGGE